MGCLRNAMLLALLAVPLACEPAAPPLPPGPITEGPWEPLESTEYRMATANLGPTPNSGLLLPMVSPDGEWIAYLQTPPHRPAGLEDLIRGDGCEGNSLLLRQTAPDASARVVCDAGVMWATWSPAGGMLIFTARGGDGRGILGLHDLASGATQRRAVGPRRLAMPSVSPDGDRVALVNADDFPHSSRIYILNLTDRMLQPGPPLSKGSRQLWPQWTDERTVVFLDWGRQTSHLRRWSLGQASVQTLTPLGDLPSTAAAMQLFISISRPVSPDGGALVCYDRLADRLAVVDLTKGTTRGVGLRTRAGCWMGPDLLAAADKDLFTFSDGGRTEGGRLLRGLWLPLWASQEGDTILLCTQGATEDAFELVRVYLVWRR